MVALGGCQAGGPGLDGGMRSPITAGGDGSLLASGLGGTKWTGTSGVCFLGKVGLVPDSLLILNLYWPKVGPYGSVLSVHSDVRLGYFSCSTG